MDFVGPLPRSHPGGYLYILTVRDVFSRWIEGFPTRDMTAETVARLLITEVFSRFGYCESIHTNQGAQFTSSLMKDTATLLGIKMTHTPAYNPKSNPVERVHRYIGAALTAFCMKKSHKWADYLPLVLFAIRAGRCRSTIFSPFQILFGREPILNLDSLFPVPSSETWNSEHAYVNQLRDKSHEVHTTAREVMKLTVERQRNSYHRAEKRFEPGDHVWLFTP
jgi:transposase InsO family protein